MRCRATEPFLSCVKWINVVRFNFWNGSRLTRDYHLGCLFRLFSLVSSPSRFYFFFFCFGLINIPPENMCERNIVVGFGESMAACWCVYVSNENCFAFGGVQFVQRFSTSIVEQLLGLSLSAGITVLFKHFLKLLNGAKNVYTFMFPLPEPLFSCLPFSPISMKCYEYQRKHCSRCHCILVAWPLLS